MEYQDFERITVLKVRKLCCEAYQKKLQKKLLKQEGVSSVEIKPEKSVVLIIGKVDPNSLLNIVARTGKHAEIVCSIKKLSHSKCCNNSQISCGQYSCCQDDSRSHKIQEDEQQHKCEDYPPPFVDERMCRDHFCRPRSWRPASEFSGYFGHAGGPFWHGPLWLAAEPPPPDRRRHWPGFYEYGYFH